MPKRRFSLLIRNWYGIDTPKKRYDAVSQTTQRFKYAVSETILHFKYAISSTPLSELAFLTRCIKVFYTPSKRSFKNKTFQNNLSITSEIIFLIKTECCAKETIRLHLFFMHFAIHHNLENFKSVYRGLLFFQSTYRVILATLLKTTLLRIGIFTASGGELISVNFKPVPKLALLHRRLWSFTMQWMVPDLKTHQL